VPLYYLIYSNYTQSLVNNVLTFLTQISKCTPTTPPLWFHNHPSGLQLDLVCMTYDAKHVSSHDFEQWESYLLRQFILINVRKTYKTVSLCHQWPGI